MEFDDASSRTVSTKSCPPGGLPALLKSATFVLPGEMSEASRSFTHEWVTSIGSMLTSLIVKNSATVIVETSVGLVCGISVGTPELASGLS
jgi:hypothetical protein